METVNMTNLEAFKKHLSSMLVVAQAQLQNNDGIQSYFVTNDGFEFEEAPIELSPEMKDIEAIQMEAVCSNPSITQSALILDVSSMTVPTEDIPKYNGVSIKDHPESIKSLLVILNTADKSYIRTMPYRKKASGEYWFGDQGWQEAPEVLGAFKNPHKI